MSGDDLARVYRRIGQLERQVEQLTALVREVHEKVVGPTPADDLVRCPFCKVPVRPHGSTARGGTCSSCGGRLPASPSPTG